MGARLPNASPGQVAARLGAAHLSWEEVYGSLLEVGQSGRTGRWIASDPGCPKRNFRIRHSPYEATYTNHLAYDAILQAA
jgi:hypothetical protein